MCVMDCGCNCVLSAALSTRMLSGRRQIGDGAAHRGALEESGLLNDWIVLMEATPGHDGWYFHADMLRQLVSVVATASPVALHHPERYAVQLEVTAPDPVHALTLAFSRWSEAVRQSGAPTWEVVRAEVLTRAEFEHDCQTEELGNGVNGRGQKRTQGPGLADEFSQ